MGNIFEISSIINTFAPILFFGGVGIYFLYQHLKKKGYFQKRKTISDEYYDMSKVKRKDIEEFNVLDDIENDLAVTLEHIKYTSALSCGGFSYNKAALSERKMVESNYIGFYNMLSWDTQLYVQSRLIDAESHIKYNAETIDLLGAELEKCVNERTKLLGILSADSSKVSQVRREQYIQDFENVERMIESLNFQIRHKEEVEAYLRASSDENSTPQFESYIVSSYDYDDDEYSSSLTKEERYKEAEKALETKNSAISYVMKKCLVNSDRLNRERMAELFYRAYNLSDADKIKFTDRIKNTSSFDLYTTTDYHQLSDLQFAADVLKKDLDDNTEDKEDGVA